MTTEERLGRELAIYMGRNYDDEEESQMARDLAKWLLENYEIRRKLIFL